MMKTIATLIASILIAAQAGAAAYQQVPPTYTPVNLANGMVAWWPLDDYATSTGIRNAVAGAKSGILYNGAAAANTDSGTTPCSTAGKPNLGIAFDGVNDCVWIPAASVNITTIGSISYWVCEYTTQQVQTACIIGQATSALTNYEWKLSFMNVTGQSNGLYFNGLSGATNVGRSATWAILSPLQGTWAHYAVSLDLTTTTAGLSHRMWRNGFPGGNATPSNTTTGLNNTNGGLSIGCNYRKSDGSTIGPNWCRISDVRFWNRWLTDTEAKYLYNSGLGTLNTQGAY